jgi:signal peptidase
MDGEEGKPITTKKPRGQLVLFLRDSGIALMFVFFILLAMFAYSGLWPPLVVVESNSMMHGDDNISHIGAIDTGDLVLVKKINHASDITTYMDGLSTGYKTYGDYGDVIIYKKGGSETLTPIIHRALIYLEPNADGLSYRSASLQNAPTSEWSANPLNDTWDHLTGTLTLKNFTVAGLDHQIVQIDIGNTIRYFEALGIGPRAGFITKGDHNPYPDQSSWIYAPVVDIGWIVGKARGEIPWFGLLKLWTTHSVGSPVPENSARDLWISLALIIISPIAVDITLSIREKRLRARETEPPEQDKPPRQEETPPPNPPDPS